MELASQHPRVSFLRPSIGVGGHCIPVDPWLLHQVAPDSSPLIGTARQVNRNRERLTASRIRDDLEGAPAPVVVLAGVAYKPDVSDVRESPTLRIAAMLESAGVAVRLYDPLALPDQDDLMTVVGGAHLLAVTVPHQKMVESIRGPRERIESAMSRLLDGIPSTVPVRCFRLASTWCRLRRAHRNLRSKGVKARWKRAQRFGTYSGVCGNDSLAYGRGAYGRLYDDPPPTRVYVPRSP